MKLMKMGKRLEKKINEWLELQLDIQTLLKAV